MIAQNRPGDDRPARLGRFAGLDERPVNLDGFSKEDHDAGLVAFASAQRPGALDRGRRRRPRRPSSTACRPPTSTSSTRSSPRTASTPTVAREANALDDVAFARLIVDPGTPREDVVRLARGATPAKLARVVALLRPVELQMAITKMRVRRTPSSQAHVTNRLDDPLLLAADAATAVAFGFREVETTVPVQRRRALQRPGRAHRLAGRRRRRAHAVLHRGGPGAGARPARPHHLRRDRLAVRHRAGLRRRRRHALVQGLSLLGLRLARPQDAGHQRRRRGGAHGRRRGQVDVLPRVALRRARPGDGRAGRAERRHRRGQRGRLACPAACASCSPRTSSSCSATSSRARATTPSSPSRTCGARRTPCPSSSPARTSSSRASARSCATTTCSAPPTSTPRTSTTTSCCSATGTWTAPCGRSPRSGCARCASARPGRRRRCTASWGWRSRASAEPDASGSATTHVEEVVVADGSKDITPPDPQAVLAAADAIMRQGASASWTWCARWRRTGFEEEAGRVLAMGRARVAGDYLQTAAIFDEQMNVLSKVTDPNDYQGPGTGYEVAPARREEMAGIRQQRSRDDLLARHGGRGGSGRRRPLPPRRARRGAARHRPARGLRRRLAGVRDQALAHDVRAAGGRSAARRSSPASRRRAARPASCACASTVDLGVIGLTAAQLAGSGIGVGLQAKGTALIHRRDLPPLACLELFSIAPAADGRAVPRARAQRRPPRQGPAAGARPQPVHRPGDRGALPRRGRRAGRRRARRDAGRRAAGGRRRRAVRR